MLFLSIQMTFRAKVCFVCCLQIVGTYVAEQQAKTGQPPSAEPFYNENYFGEGYLPHHTAQGTYVAEQQAKLEADERVALALVGGRRGHLAQLPCRTEDVRIAAGN